MTMRRTIVAVIVALTLAVPDLLACGDKFLLSGWHTRFQRPKNARAASVLIYADPASAMPATLKKEKIESVLRLLGGHDIAKAQTIPELSRTVSNGHFDLILTTNGNLANVQSLVRALPNAPGVLPIEDLVKNRTLLNAIDKEVLQRDQNRKKTAKQ